MNDLLPLHTVLNPIMSRRSGPKLDNVGMGCMRSAKRSHELYLHHLYRVSGRHAGVEEIHVKSILELEVETGFSSCF